MSVSKMVSAKKMGSKLAQGVRQVMKQGKTPEIAVKKSAKQMTGPSATKEAVSKAGSARVVNKPQVGSREDAYKILHPDRVWPD